MAVKIMIVDDEPITRMDLKEVLEENGYDVVGEGRNGEEAIEKAYLLNPDLIIMDVKMPRVNGIKASSVIKGFSDCSILLLTAYSHRELIEKAKVAEVNGYLVKPVSERELLPAVEMVLNERSRFKTLKKEMDYLNQKMAERKLIEKAKGIMMHKLACTESEAYRTMQKKSMMTQIPLARLALQVIENDK
jgi:AmiR/NasT family two-component response regulator